MESHIEIFEKYFHQTLNPDEKQHFEAKMSRDPAIREEWLAYLMSQQVIERQISNSLRQQMKAWDQENKSTILNLIPLHWIKYAATLILPLAFAWIYSNHFYSDKALVSEFNQVVDLNTRGEQHDNEPITPMQEMTEIRKLVFSNAPLAVQQAEKLLEKYKTGEYGDAAEWTLAMAYLESGDEHRCRALLENMSASKTHLYNSRSKLLLDKLNSRWRSLSF